jgi:hypothetical protein
MIIGGDFGVLPKPGRSGFRPFRAMVERDGRNCIVIRGQIVSRETTA